MVAYNIQFGPGITVGAGIDIGPPVPASTISIEPWYITNEGSSGSLVTSLGSGSWLVSPTATIASAIYFEAAAQGTLSQWLAKFASAGFDPDYSYAWNATWATGGTTVVRMAIGTTGTATGDPNLLKVIPIDINVSGWEISNPFITSALTGVYTLPVTFTPYVPTTQMTNTWA